jgi:anti-sigma factor RsiW
VAPELTHTDIQELLGAYALDAVDADEAAAIDAHLVGCPRCRSEVAEHREAATLLSFSGATAPDAVWSRIAADLEETPPPFVPPRPDPGRRATDVARRRRTPMGLVAAAIALAAAVIGLLGAQVVRQDRRIDQLAAIADQRGLGQAAAAAAVAPDARTVRLASDDGARTVAAVVLPDGQGYLVEAHLPALDRDQTYQLWGVIGAQTISLGVIGGDPTVTPFKATGPLTALAITAEHTGGAVAPTTAPIVQGFVTTA